MGNQREEEEDRGRGVRGGVSCLVKHAVFVTIRRVSAVKKR